MFGEKIILNAFKRIGKWDASRLSKQTIDESVQVIKNISYLNSGDEMHQLNILHPKKVKGPLPTIFGIHGGGWLYGDKELNRNHYAYLSSKGFTVISISYRLAPKVKIWDQIKDVFAALKWVEENNGKYNIDTSRLFVTGDSAGGHLAMMTGLSAESKYL